MDWGPGQAYGCAIVEPGGLRAHLSQSRLVEFKHVYSEPICMWMEAVSSDEFLSVARPALEKSCPKALAETVARRWGPDQLCHMLQHDHRDVRKVACVTLGLIGSREQVHGLMQVLRDPDPHLNKLADDALCSIWCRAGRSQAQRCFRQGLLVMHQERPEEAIQWFGRAQQVDPLFAEALHQRAIAHDMLEQWSEAIAVCTAALDLEPNHFRVWAMLGHCHALSDELEQAAECYRHAVKLNPHMNQIVFAISCLKSCLASSVSTADG